MTPAARPIMMAESGPIYPDPGVIATNPATAPDAAPSMVGLPLAIHSLMTHDIAAAAAAMCVTTNALTARPFAWSADPALKPNQPTHSKDAPMTVNGRLCGAVGSTPYPNRLPMINIATSAETPELM